MKQFRVSIPAMMAFILYVSLAFAAVKHPSPLWAEAWLTATLAVLTAALIGGVYLKGSNRAFWGGFALVGWGFVILTLFPSFDEKFAPRLVSHRLVARQYQSMSHAPISDGEKVWVQWEDKFYEGRAKGTPMGPSQRVRFNVSNPGANSYGNVDIATQFSNLRPLSPDSYQQLCHVILAPLLALIGGVAARTLAARDPEVPTH